MSLNEISNACSKIRSDQGSIQLIEGNSFTVLDSSYSANSTGVIADLDYLNTYSGQKIIVMPCLIELGSAGGNVHKRIGTKINEVCDLGIITTKDYFAYLKFKAKNVILIEDPDEIIKKLKEYPNATILLEGRIPKKIKEKLCR